MILVTCSSVTAEKEANVGGGESGVMCRKLSEVEKIECIFSIFSVKNSTNLSAKNTLDKIFKKIKVSRKGQIITPTSHIQCIHQV